MKNRGRPKLPAEQIKGAYIEMRLDAAEKEAFNDAALAAGMSLSAWCRDRLRKASRRELEAMERPVAFLGRASA